MPAYAQERYIQDIVKYGKSGQYVIFIPGNFAAYIMNEVLQQEKINKKFYIGELDNLSDAAKFFKKNELTIKEHKKTNKIGFLEDYPTQIKAAILTIFPTVVEEPSILQVNLMQINPPLHVVSTILNASRIEQTGPYETSGYDVTPSIAHVIEKIDLERKPLADYFGICHVKILDVLNGMYPSPYDNLYDFLKNIPVYHRQISPCNLRHRYISGEIPYYFVPLVLLAKKIGIAMPLSESFVHIGNALNQTDYWKEGRDICSFF